MLADDSVVHTLLLVPEIYERPPEIVISAVGDERSVRAPQVDALQRPAIECACPEFRCAALDLGNNLKYEVAVEKAEEMRSKET